MLFHHPHLNKINNQPSSKLNILQSKPFTQKNRSHTLIYGCQTHALHLSCSYHSSCLTLQQLKMAGFNSVPNWLLILKEEKFFTRCLSHGSVKKNEKNVFCLDCCTSICLHCLPFHRSHVFLQIRRYMYYDVLRLGDAETVLNCSLVQPYTTNKTKVVFLKQRPHTRSHRGSSNLCITCDRNLQDPYIFCSLSCKVQQHLLLITESTTMEGTCNKYEFSVLLDKERSRENAQQIEDSQITTDSELDSPTVSGSTSVAESVNDSLKKKRGSVDLVPEIWYTMVNRRKGVPHRSPLY
ncbi:uncharacterized protein LOC114173273 isoform X4 [Vigna unguiculata]|uniref:uncharacterized protein LOC114173273 isoform X4 n=1 Tax=Vigna unguiculata TaxID=3917 RepID=UPI001016F9A9|nr:uncharacterized protein LOC114173273 isoform X4 [Vigna unguiculata]